MSQNQQIGKIATQTAFKARSRFNLDHDYNTTLTFGETQPSFIREMIPGSKLEIKSNSLVRLAPMPAPTFGRMKIENRSHFIPISSLVKHFQDSFLTQTIVSEGPKTFKVETLPHIQLARLSWYILTGARCTIYKTSALDESYLQQTVKGYNMTDETSRTALQTLLSSLRTAQYLTPLRPFPTPPIGEYGEDYIQIIPERLFNVDDELPSGTLDLSMCTTIPIANKSEYSFGLNQYSSTLDETGEGDYVHGAVHLNSADYVHTVTRSNGDILHFAFRLSNFGKRLRKILIGLGYQIDFRATNQVSILPLFAYYKAYFDSFGLTLYQNYLHTNAARCLTDFDYNNNPSYNDYDETFPKGSFRSFIYDLGNCFATAPQDYISSHTVTTAVSPNAGGALSYVNVDDGIIPINQQDSSIPNASTDTNPHAFINQVIHSHLDSEYLKKLYKWTNRNTIAGKRIREILISQGFGDWIDKQKTFFIGQDEQRIEIMEISSTADTTQIGGSSLGEWAGKGRSEKQSKKHSYETDEHGYFITISTLVPEGGYTQALSDHVNELSKFDFYNPEFDSMGYDASRFSETVCGTQNWSQHGGDQDDATASLTETFGFKPRYLEKKVQFNKMNGDFNLRSTRNSYLPYTLDKIIDVGEREVTESTERIANEPYFFVKKRFPITDIPSAGDVWRYYYRYAWLSNFNRIFVNGGAIQYFPQGDEIDFISQEMEATQADNFLLHQYNEVTYQAPMLSISHSYETTDDYGGSSHDMGKA